LGPGLLESAYEECLVHELHHSGLVIERQKPLPVVYKDIRLDHGYRADLIVMKLVLVEIKSVDLLTPVHMAQVLTYLRFSRLRTGLLINFNVTTIPSGLKRFVL
jgi:GxxExxY protein